MSVLLVNIRLFTLLSTSQKHGRENLHHLRASLTGHKWPAGRSRGGKSTASEGTAEMNPLLENGGKEILIRWQKLSRIVVRRYAGTGNI